jgi:metal-responsive CopG/Arc/MetJ family transcriptional regulator
MKPIRTRRAHVILPEDLVREIDSIVGSRGRSSFLVETAREAIRRRKLLQFLENEEPAWKDADHPELSRGSAAWVRKIRRESEKRIKKAYRGPKG